MLKNIKNNFKKPVLLCVLDGWGIGRQDDRNNAIALANLPNYQQINANYPHSKLSASGADVGLPDGQMGNSEVGHMIIGAGRVILQDLPRINRAIETGELENNLRLKQLITACKKSGGACHLMGLLSDGGVHSHEEHIIALAKIIAKNGVKVWLHAFLDGRDTGQKSALSYVSHFLSATKEYSGIKIASLSGRYYAMDRDHNWQRTKLAYDCLVSSAPKANKSAAHIIEDSYKSAITDEFVLPCALEGYPGMKDGDGILFANFRADRIRQIASSLLEDDFLGFKQLPINFAFSLSMTEYSDKLNQNLKILFPSLVIKNSLGEVLQNQELTQLRIAETEKYAHVTFFFSAGREQEFIGEERILIKSPAVATYDLLPEMAAEELSEKLLSAISSGSYDFILVNYANPDMVGHSGVLEAAVKACQAIDKQLEKLYKAILEVDGLMIITADHGNIEKMTTEDNQPHTAHTTNPVPFIVIGNDLKNIAVQDGSLADIAPTILHLMNIACPEEMTGKNLIIKQK